MRKIPFFYLLVLVVSPALAQNVDQKAYERYVNVELYNQMVPGYYLSGKKKVEVSIKYVPPIDLQDASQALIINKGKEDEELSKSKIDAFSVNSLIYIPEEPGDSVIWVILKREGAIRETTYLKPVPSDDPTYYKINNLVTNTSTHEGIFVGSLAINFNKVMANLTMENAELSQKISSRKEGYLFIDYKKIIAEYNLWFQNQYPKRIEYIGDIPDFQAYIDKDMVKYQPKN